jgi:hypothetical protein
MENTEQASPLIRADWLDKAVGLLALAKQHNISLAVNGDKLKLTRANSVDPLVVEILISNKADIIDIMGRPDAIKSWLGDFQSTLSSKYDTFNDGMDRWDWVEKIYHDLFPVDRECVCSRGYCIDSAIITCDACAKKNQVAKGA